MRKSVDAAVLACVFACAFVLGGCTLSRGLITTVGPDYQRPTPALVPAAHSGNTATLKQWWQQFDDPLLIDLLDAAQSAGANVAQATARIARARADAIAAGVAGGPTLDGTAGASRSAFSFGGPAVIRTQAQIGLQSSWEIDLFGGLARQRESALAQFDANVAAWHDARVALAAEVATRYASYRYCEVQTELARIDAQSRAETARLSGISAGAGFQSSDQAAVARAIAADGAASLAQRQALCELDIKALVALTARDEAALRSQLTRASSTPPRLPRPAQFAIASIPAQVLSQRPDVAAAERDVAVASANIGVNEANRYPRLSLAGNITPSRSRLGNDPTISVTTWSIGPSLTMPLFDGGRRVANVDAARGQYTAAESAYRAKVRTAVREVDEALVRLASVATRGNDTRSAAAGYRANYAGVQAKQRAGLANLLELEDARRTTYAAEASVAALDYEGVSAWITLYRAAGGGWDGNFTPTTASSKDIKK